MPNTKLTKAKWSLHMQYSKWIYIALIVVGVLVGSMAFDMSAPKTPNANKVDVYIVYAGAEVSTLKDVAAHALADGQAYERQRDAAAGVDVDKAGYAPALREVNFYQIPYDEENDDGYGSQAFMVRLMTMEGDVYIVTRSELEQMVLTGLVEPLDEWIAQGVIDPGSRDLAEVTYPESVNEDEPPTGRSFVYGLQCAPMRRQWMELSYMDSQEMFMALMAFSENKDTSAAVMNSLIVQLDGEETE